MSGNGHSAWFGRVLILPVASRLAVEAPTIILNEFDNVADLHSRSRMPMLPVRGWQRRRGLLHRPHRQPAHQMPLDQQREDHQWDGRDHAGSSHFAVERLRFSNQSSCPDR